APSAARRTTQSSVHDASGCTAIVAAVPDAAQRRALGQTMPYVQRSPSTRAAATTRTQLSPAARGATAIATARFPGSGAGASPAQREAATRNATTSYAA